MDLKEFVSETLKEIIAGVKDAQIHSSPVLVRINSFGCPTVFPQKVAARYYCRIQLQHCLTT